MIKARIRWCSCRVENILTLGKLLRLWFCFLLHSILFFIFQTSYLTYKIISSYELARPIMGTIFLVLDERTISGVDLIEIMLKDGIVASFHTTVTFQEFNGLMVGTWFFCEYTKQGRGSLCPEPKGMHVYSR